jgi:hypothetical protein
MSTFSKIYGACLTVISLALVVSLTAGCGGGKGGGGGADMASSDGLVWKRANMTTFESYPDPNSEECMMFMGCEYTGEFAFVDGKQTLEWVMMHNIASVHFKDSPVYKLRNLRLKQADKQIEVTVYDECADSDCNGCCTENSAETGFLIDLEKYTFERFGASEGVIDWACLDCNF